MTRTIRAVLILVPILGFLAGCGTGEGKPATGAERVENVKNAAFDELSQMLTLRNEDSKEPFHKTTELARYEKLLPIACHKVKTGEIVLILGAPVSEGASDTIVAYEKEAPSTGGYVLMQDAKTIKKMSAEEFKTAGKAPGTASNARK